MQKTWIQSLDLGKIPWRSERLPTPSRLEIPWTRSLTCYTWGHKESDTTE